MARYVMTITEDHVRNPRTLGQDWFRIVDAIGRLLPCDAGKRVYDTGNGVWQVENNEQRDARLAKGR